MSARDSQNCLSLPFSWARERINSPPSLHALTLESFFPFTFLKDLGWEREVSGMSRRRRRRCGD